MYKLLILLTILAMPAMAESNFEGSLNTQSGNSNSNNTTDNSSTEVNGTTYSGTNVSHSTTTVKSTPQAIAPNITGGYDTCSAVKSGGASGPGFGVSFGTTVQDETCEIIKLSKLMTTLGLADAAVAIAMQDPRVAAAIQVAYPKLYNKLKPTDVVTKTKSKKPSAKSKRR